MASREQPSALCILVLLCVVLPGRCSVILGLMGLPGRGGWFGDGQERS